MIYFHAHTHIYTGSMSATCEESGLLLILLACVSYKVAEQQCPELTLTHSFPPSNSTSNFNRQAGELLRDAFRLVLVNLVAAALPTYYCRDSRRMITFSILWLWWFFRKLSWKFNVKWLWEQHFYWNSSLWFLRCETTLFYPVEGFLGPLKTSNLVQTGAFLGTTYTDDPKCRLPPITAFLHPGRSIKFEEAS